MQKIEPLRVTPTIVRSYLAHRREGGLQDSSIGRCIFALREVYGALVVEELVASNPAREIKPPRMPTRPKTPWIRDEETIKKLLNVPAQNWDERRDRLCVQLLLGLGWRRQEIASLVVEDITKDTITSTFRGGDRTTAGLPEWLAREIADWRTFAKIERGALLPRDEDDPRPVTGAIIYGTIRRVCERIGIGVVTPQMLRRTNLVLGGMRGLSLKERQLAVGHTWAHITERHELVRDAGPVKAGDVFGDLVKR